VNKAANFILAAQTPPSHNANMTAVNRFTYKIDVDPLSEHRFRWTLCEGDQVHIRSPHSYATRREAKAEAQRAVEKRASFRTDPSGA